MSGGKEARQERPSARTARTSMSCAQARQLLAASRRDEWTPAELSALSEHLSTCAACRQRQEAYRGVGERVRELPTIIPPAAFRDRVFAAIAADQAKLAEANPPTVAAQATQSARPGRESPAAKLANADTDPALPVVRALPRAPQRRRPQPRGVEPLRVVAALAAVLVFAVLASQVVAGGGFGALSNALSHVLPDSSARPTIATYSLGGTYSAVADAIAEKQWVFTIASSGAHASDEMLLALDRATGQTTPLLGAQMAGPLHIQALTPSWIIWSQGDLLQPSGWDLYASHVPAHDGASVGAPLTLLTSASAGTGAEAPEVVTGIATRGDTILVSGASTIGMGGILRFDLGSASNGASPQPQVIGTANADNLLNDLSVAGTTLYWSDASADASGHLHSAILSAPLGSGALENPMTIVSDGAFDPHVIGNTLLYIASPDAQAPSTSDTQEGTASGIPGLAQAIASVGGTLSARGLSSGKTTSIANGVGVRSVASGGSVLVYRTRDGEHSFDSQTGKPLPIDLSLRTSAYASVSAESLTWGVGSTATVHVYTLP